MVGRRGEGKGEGKRGKKGREGEGKDLNIYLSPYTKINLERIISINLRARNA